MIRVCIDAEEECLAHSAEMRRDTAIAPNGEIVPLLDLHLYRVVRDDGSRFNYVRVRDIDPDHVQFQAIGGGS